MIAASEFDSAHFGITVGRAEAQSASEVDQILAELDDTFDVVFLRTADDARVLDRLAERRIRPLEYLVTSVMEAPADQQASTEYDVTPIEREAHELAAIARISGDAIVGTHFHNDPRLPRACTRRLYEDWAANDASGRAQRTVVARASSQVIGFTAILVREQRAIIDLIAVDPAWHGKGVGTAMLGDFVRWIRSEGLVGYVGTQHDNPALALYRRVGFIPAQRQATFHLWSST